MLPRRPEPLQEAFQLCEKIKIISYYVGNLCCYKMVPSGIPGPVKRSAIKVSGTEVSSSTLTVQWVF